MHNLLHVCTNLKASEVCQYQFNSEICTPASQTAKTVRDSLRFSICRKPHYMTASYSVKFSKVIPIFRHGPITLNFFFKWRIYPMTGKHCPHLEFL